MLAKLALISSAVVALAGSARAWGAEGHQVVGALADVWIKPETKAIRNQLLPEGWTFERASTWADEVKSQKEYKWSGNLHFIDAEDVTPLDANATHPVECTIDMARDGANGVNIISAIGNYTQRLSDKYDLDARSEAAKFLSHFIGDITQPLHNCGKLLGGNQFFSSWEGNTTYIFNGRESKFQLHVIWDVYIPGKDVKDNFGGSWEGYRKWLIDETEKGQWANEKDSWLQCNTEVDGPESCPMDWATDANELNCGMVWDKTLLAGSGTSTENDLAGAYFQQTYMIVRKQLAKGGYRLAKYMDILLANQVVGNSTASVTATPTSTGVPAATSTSDSTATPAPPVYPTEKPQPAYPSGTPSKSSRPIATGTPTVEDGKPEYPISGAKRSVGHVGAVLVAAVLASLIAYV